MKRSFGRKFHRMHRSVFSLLLLLVLSLSQPAVADGEKDNHPDSVRRIPRDGVAIPKDREQQLRQRLTELQSRIADLQKKNDAQTQQLLPDVLIFERAIRGALDYNEFFSPKDIDKGDAVVEEGIDRADQLLAGKPQWPNQSGLIVRGYVSRIDHTVQPYGLVVPESYAFSQSVPTRCDIWFHGRGETLSELNFIWDRMKNAGRYTPDHTIVLHPYGRYSNAFKFAGEVDVLEGLEDVQKRYRIDEDRISVRGFSMGGAACWQFAVHYADRWFAANPGAGFSETPEFLKFFQKETLDPKPWEETLWNMYDCNRYAVNLVQCPTIAYSGEKDIQKQAADVMELALKRRGMRLRHVIGPNMGHTIDDASKKIIEADMNSLAKRGRNSLPRKIHFETYTLKYNSMHWLQIESLGEHWKKARVDAEIRDDGTINMYCDNVRRFRLDFPAGSQSLTLPEAESRKLKITTATSGAVNRVSSLTLPGPLSDGSWHVDLSYSANGGWKPTNAVDGLVKRHNLQGPIDDAFMDSFVFVRPTGTAANSAVGNWAASELDRAVEHWRRHFRGDARVVDDTDVTDELIASANLVLWGDPVSNSVMGRIADQLPVVWTNDRIKVGVKEYDAKNHAAVLIYPNPLNPKRYVVLNSSFTYRDYAYLNNARQVPMLPDWAVINLNTPPGNVWPGEVVVADFFDEKWQLKN